jgi:hypothetical protein
MVKTYDPMRTGGLTGAVDARRTNPGVILSWAEDAVQNLLFLLAEVLGRRLRSAVSRRNEILALN